VDMATTVALEMEEKRRKEEWEKMEEEAKTKVINNIFPAVSYVNPDRCGYGVCEPLEPRSRNIPVFIKSHCHFLRLC
jgi:hypothetical protein